jgi:hypothetical protein
VPQTLCQQQALQCNIKEFLNNLITQSSPTVQNGGSAIADFLLGLPVGGQIESSQGIYHLRCGCPEEDYR